MNINVGTRARSTILVCSSDSALIERVDSLFSQLASYEYEAQPLEKLLREKKFDTDAYDLVLIDVSDGEILDNPDFVAARNLLREIPVIFVSEALSNERMRQLVKLDGNDWLAKPVERRALIDSIGAQFQKLKSGKKKVHAVLSCGGGAGGTTFAIMMAYFLSRARKRTRPKVALFDLDFTTAAVAAYLNIENSFDLQSIINRPERVDLEFVDIIHKRQEKGFSVFSFESPEIVTNPRGVELVLRMLDVISFQYDHTILDMPVHETGWKWQVLSSVDTVTLVSNPTVPALQFAKNTYNRLAEVRGKETISVVINRSQTGLFATGIGRKEIGQIFGDLNVVIVPEDRKVLTEAQNRGVLPYDVSSGSAFCKQIEKMAEAVRSAA